MRVANAATLAPMGPVQVSAGAAVLDAGRLLLVRRTNPPCLGDWCLPGGLVEEGEDPRACAVREVREETGLIVDLERFLGAFLEPDNPTPLVFLLFEGNVTGGRPRPSDDADRVGFFAVGDLPPLAFASTRYAARELSAANAQGPR